MARPDFRSQASKRLAAERTGRTPRIIDILAGIEEPDATAPRADDIEIRHIPLDAIAANPDQPRLTFHAETIEELSRSIAEHGVLQPILVRPLDDDRFQLVAGERRWRASRLAGLVEVPAIVEHIDDDAALEIAIIENLQREDLSPLDEAAMYERMTTDHGYSVRKLASKLGKDKGYVENRLRLTDAPDDVRELVADRHDTLSHAYELMKVSDPRKRKRLARQVASGELSLVKLRQRIEGRPKPEATVTAADRVPEPEAEKELVAIPIVPDPGPPVTLGIDVATEHLATAVEELASALVTDDALGEASTSERQAFAKYLTVAKIKLDNAIAVVRAGDRPRPLHEQLRAASAKATEEVGNGPPST